MLADTYLHEKSYEKARDEARVAIAKGKNAASSAQLTLGQALINLGRTEEGVQALNIFLQESPQHPVAGQVRNLVAEIQDHDSPSAQPETETQTKSRLSGVDPLLALPAARLSVKSWQPPGVDDVKLAVAPDVACPAEKVIEESGKRVQELVEDLARFSAIEDLFHQALDEYGVPVRTETRKFNYVASISEPRPGFLSVDEFRADNLNIAGYPDHISSTGFATLAFVFHPHMRDNFNISCEGLGDWRGQPSWLVHFIQRDDRPNTMHSYKVGNKIYPVKLKRRAWITADKFQIVRIEAEMASSMPEIQLLSEHQVVEYGPIPFLKKNFPSGCRRPWSYTSTSASIGTTGVIVLITTCSSRWIPKRSRKNRRRNPPRTGRERFAASRRCVTVPQTLEITLHSRRHNLAFPVV